MPFPHLQDLQEMYILQNFITALLNRCTKDFILVKDMRVATNVDDYASRLTFDADYQEFDTLAEAVQNRCPGDFLICRSDYKPVSEERKQELIGKIDEFLKRKT